MRIKYMFIVQRYLQRCGLMPADAGGSYTANVASGRHHRIGEISDPEGRGGKATAETTEHLAGNEHPPLLAIEVSEASGVGLVGPLEPEFLDFPDEIAVSKHRRRLDAGADHVAGQPSIAFAA
jgi:hypothetical protein